MSPSADLILLNSVVSPLEATWIEPKNVPVSTPDSTILTFVLLAEEVWMNTSLKRDCATEMLVFLSASTSVTNAYVSKLYESAPKARVASDELNDKFFDTEEADGEVSL